MYGETAERRRARLDRQRQKYPELEVASPHELGQIDRVFRARGEAPTTFGARVEADAAELYAGRGSFDEVPADPYDDRREVAPIAPKPRGYRGVPPPSSGGGVFSGLRDAIPKGVRDVAGRAAKDTFGQLTNAYTLADAAVPRYKGKPLGGFTPGTDASEQIRRIPRVGGALDTAVSIGLAPATLGSAGIGPGAAASFKGLPLAARIPLNIAAPASRSANFGTRLAAETAIGTAATVGAQETAKRTDNPFLIGAAGLGAGVLASGAVTAAPRTLRGAKKGALKYRDLTENIPMGMSVKRVVDATETTPRVVMPPETGDIIGLKPIEAGLSKGQERLNAVRRVLGGVEDNDITTPAMAERARVKPQIESQAKRFGMTAQASVKQAFPDFDGVRVPSLEGIDPTIPGAPGIADVAARLPMFDDVLTPAQRQVMATLRDESSRWKSLLDENMIEVGARQDVMDGGFYLPRGRADLEGMDAPVKVRAGGVGGTSSGYKKGAVFASQAEGISKGYEYSPLGEVLESYGRQAGNDALNAHLKQYFLAATKDGEAVFESAADRLDPGLRGEALALRSKIGGLSQTVRNQGVRATAQEGEAGRAASRYGLAYERTDSALGRFYNLEARHTTTTVTGDLPTSTATRRRNLAALPSIESIEKRITSLSKQVERGKDGQPLRNKANTARMERLGRLYAQADVREAIGDSAVGRDLADALEPARSRLGNYLVGDAAPTGSSVRAPAFGSPERAAWEADRAAFGATQQRGGQINYRGEQPPASANEPTAVLRAHETALERLANTLKVTERVHDSEGVLKAVQREISVLEREVRRAGRAAQTTAERAAGTGERQNASLVKLRGLREEYDALMPRLQAAQKKAAETPRDAGRVGLPGMQGYTAADEVVNAANKILRNEGLMSGAGTIPLRAFSSLNNFQRGLRATGDNSFAMIQGLLGFGDDPQAYRRAMSAMIRAWGDPDATGKALLAFDERISGTGRLTSSDWAKVLHYTGPDTEFAAGQGLPARAKSAFQKSPVIKQSNRAFGTAGDVLRPEWADTLLEQEMKSTGRTAQQLWDDGTVERIGRIVNRMTGTVPGSKVGNYTDAFLFAGRFMQSKLETLTLAAKGTLKGPIPGVETTLEERAARRALLRMIALGTAMTIAANEVRGEETDFRPIVNGRKNSNFMRIRAGERDYSLFGTWDSLLGQMVNLGMAGKKAAGGDYAGGADQVFDSLRGIASTPIALAWDLISGEDGIGQPTRDTKRQTFQTIAESFTPFSSAETAGSLGTVARGVVSGDPAQAAQALGEGLYANLGGKSSPLSASDQVAEGNYSDLKGEAQFNAIKPQAWRVVGKPFADQVDGYSSYGAWYAARLALLTKNLSKTNPPGVAAEMAEQQVGQHPVTQAYLDVKNTLETQWIAKNKADADRLIQEGRLQTNATERGLIGAGAR